MDSEQPQHRSVGSQVALAVRRMFISGVLITVPIIVTYLVLNFLFENVDGILSPLVERIFGYSVPGMGLIATLLLILLVGILGRNVVGSRLVALGEAIITRTPLARTIYGAAKQLVEAVTKPNEDRFKRTVLIEYPRKGTYAIGFASGRTRLQTGATSEELVAIFVPSTPTPVTGFVVLIPRRDVVELAMSAEDAIKFLVSGGLAAPSALTRADHNMVEA